MEIWEYLILFLAPVIGGGVGFYIQSYNKTAFTNFLALTGAYLFGITILHLLPDVFSTGNQQIGIFIMAGFLIQILVDQLSKGLEHGHIHAAQAPKAGFAISILLGLSIHSFMEGMPLSGYEIMHEHAGHSHHHIGTHNLLYAITFHKIPAAFALVVLMLLSGFKSRTTFLMLLTFALMSPLGAISAQFLHNSGVLQEDAFNVLMAIVVGSFLHISTTILFENEPGHHHVNWLKISFVLLGFILAILSS